MYRFGRALFLKTKLTLLWAKRCFAVVENIVYYITGVAQVTGLIVVGIASWDRGSATCSDTYCHGDFRGGNPLNIPVWTANSQDDCGSCHDVGTNPESLRDRHKDHDEEGILCFQCHSSTVDNALNIVGPAVHIDGTNDISFSSGEGTYANGECSNVGCHDTETW